MTTVDNITATTDEAGRRNDAHTSLPFDDQPVRLLAREDGESK